MKGQNREAVKSKQSMARQRCQLDWIQPSRIDVFFFF